MKTNLLGQIKHAHCLSFFSGFLIVMTRLFRQRSGPEWYVSVQYNSLSNESCDVIHCSTSFFAGSVLTVMRCVAASTFPFLYSTGSSSNFLPNWGLATWGVTATFQPNTIQCVTAPLQSYELGATVQWWGSQGVWTTLSNHSNPFVGLGSLFSANCLHLFCSFSSPGVLVSPIMR